MEQLEFKVIISGSYQAIQALEDWLDDEAAKQGFISTMVDATKAAIMESGILGKKKIIVTVADSTL